VSKTYICDGKCDAVCDFCQWYRFNGTKDGIYIDEGECVHPDHPHKEEPYGWCDDFHCAFRADADPVQAAAARASIRRPDIS
jgi:hypothetical protein